MDSFEQRQSARLLAPRGVDDRDEEERRERGHGEAADDRAAERRVLLPPSPRPSDIGSMPSTIASAVITTGRRRVTPASHAAPRASSPSLRRSLANVTTRMLFDVATPML